MARTIVSAYEANNATAAITAEPIAKPLVTAFVVLPTASRPTMIRSGSPSNSPAISAIPAALSATGPKVSSATMMPVVASMPMPVRATRYSENATLPPPRPSAAPMATAIATRAHTADSRPREIPSSTVVAGPVRAALAMSFTGLVLVEVKYCVIFEAAKPRMTPTTMAPKRRAPGCEIVEPLGLPM
ncbi:unannotated protein [freshwater metagenome]|uniref:Unannotated protein n=1 Tax=freshwater metagenome TaxID=449393 RepID=A0A6J6DT08_9ZZZZ